MLVLGVFAEDAKRGARSPTTTATSATPSSKRQPLRRRGLRQADRRSTSSRPTARWSTTSASTSRPSVVVIDRDLKGTVLTGYVDRVSINQAIADARRDSIDPDITDAYLREANADLRRFELRIDRWSLPDDPRQEGRAAPS